MEQKPEEQNNEFINEELADILKKNFKVGPSKDRCEKKSLEAIIDWIIDHVKNKGDYVEVRDCIKKYWFTKQIEDWKKKNNKTDDPSDAELMNIVKEDLKIRTANTILELRKQTGINDENIWFNNEHEYASIVKLQNDNNIILTISQFNDRYYYVSPPYKPFFMNNQNDNGKLNGVCIYKHGNDENEDGKSKTKWIMACFKDDGIVPQCKITFKTNKNDKIKNVEIKTAKDENSELTYTISLNDKGDVVKITKNDEEEENEDKNNYDKEIKQLLFEDETNKVLIERIEDELDGQQKQVWDSIKIALNKIEEKEESQQNNNKQLNASVISEEGNDNENYKCNCGCLTSLKSCFNSLCTWN